MKKKLLFLALLLSIVVAACTTKCPPLTDAQKADIEKQVLVVWDKYMNAWEKADFDSLADVYSSNEFITCYNGGFVQNSKEQIFDSVRLGFNRRKVNETQIKFNEVSVKVTPFTEDLALLTQSWIGQTNFKDGRTAMSKQALSVIFKREANGWKIIHRHQSYR